MTHDEWNVFAEKFVQGMKDLLVAKGKDYNDGTADRLQNFKNIAAETGVSPQQAALVLCAKHWDAIKRHCRGHLCTTEPLEQRLLDVANYMVLIAGLERDRIRKEGSDGAEA